MVMGDNGNDQMERTARRPQKEPPPPAEEGVFGAREGTTSPYLRIQSDLELLFEEQDPGARQPDRVAARPDPAARQWAPRARQATPAEGPGGRAVSPMAASAGPPSAGATSHHAQAGGQTAEGVRERRPSDGQLGGSAHGHAGENGPSRSLWIGNIDGGVTEEQVLRAFMPFGAIESVRILVSKECAFVNFATEREATAARERMQGALLGSNAMRIGYGRADLGGGGHAAGSAKGSSGHLFGEASSNGHPPPSNGSAAFCTGSSSSSTLNGAAEGPVQSCSVWVGHIGLEMDEEALCKAFGRFGPIESCRILESKNCAFVNFTEHADADSARRTMNGAQVGSAVIKTGYAKVTTARGDADGSSALGLPSQNSRGAREDGLCPREAFAKGAAPYGLPADGGGRPAKGPGSGGGDRPVAMVPSQASDEMFNVPLYPIPAHVRLSPDLTSAVIRECRRRIEYHAAPLEEIDNFADKFMSNILAAALDPVGNILVQKVVEKCSGFIFVRILRELGLYTATAGVHKNGTWAVQKIIASCRTDEQKRILIENIRPHIVALMQDQYGNYVVQCCLAFRPALNQFICDALYHCCVEIGTSRFGSRAMRSCLESEHISEEQRKYVAMAIISHASVLSADANGIIIMQWLLESDLPGRHSFVAQVLRGHFVSLCQSKHASVLVARLIHHTVPAAARDALVAELFASPHLQSLLLEPTLAAIVLRALNCSSGEQKVKYSHVLEPLLPPAADLSKLPHLQRIAEETRRALDVVEFERASSEVERRSSCDSGTSLSSIEARLSSFDLAPTLVSHAVGGPTLSGQLFVKDGTGRRGSRGDGTGGTADDSRSDASSRSIAASGPKAAPKKAASLSSDSRQPAGADGDAPCATNGSSFGPSLCYTGEAKNPKNEAKWR